MSENSFGSVGKYNASQIDNPSDALPIKHAFCVDVNIATVSGRHEAVMVKDYGYIVLPKNYKAEGEAVRLVIVCHGASTDLTEYQSTEIVEFSQTYWVNMGYAIMDMYACPPELGNGSEMHYGNPSVLECYENGYLYVMENFNLKKDGVFVVGSSMGGLSSFQIVLSRKLPVLAHVANAPAIDLFKQAYCNPWTKAVYQREKIAYYFGFEGEKPAFTEEKPIPTENEIEYFKKNSAKTLNYSPIFAAAYAGDKNAAFGKIPTSATNADEEEAKLYSMLSAAYPCPLLIIHNKDDSRVSYRYSEYLYAMIRRGDSKCDVRLKLYEEGGHTAWDYGPTAEISDYEGNPIVLSQTKRMAIDFFREYDP